MPEGLTPAQIDDFVAAAMHTGEDLYHLDGGALADLDADLVVTQDLCAVCAVDVSVVDDALAYLGCRAEVLTLDPARGLRQFPIDGFMQEWQSAGLVALVIMPKENGPNGAAHSAAGASSAPAAQHATQ